jgi:membrane-associated phospholipid phosphatase
MLRTISRLCNQLIITKSGGPTMAAQHAHPIRLSRRNALRAGAAVGAAALTSGIMTPAPTVVQAANTDMIEPTAGTWKTWLLRAGNQLRLTAPPSDATTRDEIAQLQNMVAQRDPKALDRIAYWDSGSPGYRWNEIALAAANKAGLTADAYRVLALLNAAIYDATIAAWDSKYTFNRPRPSTVDATLKTVLANPASPSYPSEHAVAAGAAATLLGFLFPQDAPSFAEMAQEAARTRLLAGVHYPSDVQAGLDLGRAVGALAVDRAKSDGSDAKWTGTVPVGPGLWQGDPFAPLMGTWKTWVLSSGSQFRSPPPPAYDSPQRAAEIAEVKNYQRDANRGVELGFWPEDPAGRPAPDSVPISSNQLVFYYAPGLHFVTIPELTQKLFEYRLDTNAPRAARAYALTSIALYDSTVASWDSKYFYWTGRPIHFDPTITTVLPTYPIPDYPSGHSTGHGGVAPVLGYLFPRDAHFFQSRAAEDAASRLWAGIHFRSACDEGLRLGGKVAQAVIEWAKGDGSQ